MNYVWFLWSLILLGVWALVFTLLRDRESKREMLLVSLATSAFGLTEPVFVPDYWNPPSLFDLTAKTGFDIESILFSFAVGGLAVALYEWVFPSRHTTVPVAERSHPRHRLHPWALLSAPLTFGVLYLPTRGAVNPIYTTTFALLVGGVLSAYSRPDLIRKMVVSSALFVGLYFVFFVSLTLAFPDYVEDVWNLSVLSGIVIVGVPVEELAFAAAFGFMWSSTYEQITWRTPNGARRPAKAGA